MNLGIETESTQRKIRRAVESGSTYTEPSLEYTTSSGKKRLMRLIIIPLNDLVGDGAGAMMLSEDVTEEKKLEAVQDALLCAECIVETMREPLIVLDSDLRV